MKAETNKVKPHKSKKKIVGSGEREEKILIASAKEATSKAIRSTKALGLSYKIIKGDEIITVNPDQSEKVEGKIAKSTFDVSKLKKGMYLVRK